MQRLRRRRRCRPVRPSAAATPDGGGHHCSQPSQPAYSASVSVSPSMSVAAFEGLMGAQTAQGFLALACLLPSPAFFGTFTRSCQCITVLLPIIGLITISSATGTAPAPRRTTILRLSGSGVGAGGSCQRGVLFNSRSGRRCTTPRLLDIESRADTPGTVCNSAPAPAFPATYACSSIRRFHDTTLERSGSWIEELRSWISEELFLVAAAALRALHCTSARVSTMLPKIDIRERNPWQ